MFQTEAFTYVHMQKTGGVRIRQMLAELTGGQDVGRRHGFYDRKPSDRLVFGSIRDPLAWYVSLWAFGCEGHGGVLSWLKDDPDWLRLYADANDASLFREWLYRCYDEHYMDRMRNGYEKFSLRGRVGFMTYRYAYLYLPGVDLETAPDFGDYFDLEEYDRRYNMVDAWIKLEDMGYSLFAALKLAGYEVSRERVEALCETRANTSQHGHFLDYYDPASLQMVRDREQLIVDRHGYHSHHG